MVFETRDSLVGSELYARILEIDEVRWSGLMGRLIRQQRDTIDI